MKDAYYFSHDANARNDPKISAMRSVYGTEGYGRYWIIVEMLRDQADYRLPLDKYIDHTLAVQMQCERNAAAQFLHDCINEFHLFKSDNKSFWSESLCRRMTEKEDRSKKAQAAAQMRWQSERNADAMRTQSERNAIKRKKKKGKSIEATPLEQAVLDELGTVEHYGLDPEKDIPFLQKLAADYPHIDLLAEAKKWATYKLDKPLQANSSPRGQFRTWVSKARPNTTAPTSRTMTAAEYMAGLKEAK